MPGLNALAAKDRTAGGTYGDAVRFVHVYVIEPHPKSPNVSPYRGAVWEARYSTLGQPTTYAGRVENALATAPLVTGNQTLLVDDLRPDMLVNPVWCTYGPAPNSAYLIRQDGVIDTAQLWTNVNDLEAAIDKLLR